MVVGIHRRSVGVFSHRRDAEEALHELKQSGFPMDRVSVIAQNSDGEHIAGTPVQEKVGNKADEGAATGAISGGVLGGLGGLLVGLGTLAIPGIGPIMLAGATATALATTLAGAGIGAVAGSLLGALIGLGIPEERARAYEERVRRGHYLVIIDGTDAEIAQAQAILHRRGVEDYGVYDSPGEQRSTIDVAPSKYAIGYFSHRHNAEAAINDLRSAGFPLHQISLIHRESLAHPSFTGVDVANRFDSNRWQLPSDRNDFYNDHINQGDYVIVVSGTDAEIQRAAVILNSHDVRHWHLFDNHPGTTTSRHTNKRAIGVFSHRRDAEAALGELRSAGFPMNQVSLIAKDSNTHAAPGVDRGVGNKADEGAKAGAATGGVLGGLGGLLVGLGALALPGIGPVIAGGAVATALATTLAGGAIGAAAGGIVGGLVGLGIPEAQARVYSDRFQRGDYLVIVDGTEAQIQHAETILKGRGIQEFGVFDATDIETEHRHHQGLGRVRNEDIVRTDNPVIGDRQDPAVVIVDRREERI